MDEAESGIGMIPITIECILIALRLLALASLYRVFCVGILL